MSLRIEHECPQCAAPLEMDETERLLHCRFCNVQSFLSNTGPLHFILPRRHPDPYTIYAPYLRFKGAIYSCLTDRIEHRLADISIKGVRVPFLPASLGLRPQAMKMRFASPEFPGSFLKKSIHADQILNRAAKKFNTRDETIMHQAFVGDALNIIYMPLSIRNEEIFDGVVESSLAKISDSIPPFAETEINGNVWKPIFLSALCPQCGWNLDGEPDSVVLLCSNCNSGWQAAGNHLSEVEVKAAPTTDKDALYIPFWKLEVAVQGLKLHSFADFIRATNQPLVVRPAWEDTALHFIIPAFKLRPKEFLRLGTQVTLSQRHILPATDVIPSKNLYPVTLLQTDISKSLKVVLANSAVSSSNVFPYLPAITFQVKEFFLHYLPFTKTSHEMEQKDLGITINQRVLNYGRSL